MPSGGGGIRRRQPCRDASGRGGREVVVHLVECGGRGPVEAGIPCVRANLLLGELLELLLGLPDVDDADAVARSGHPAEESAEDSRSARLKPHARNHLVVLVDHRVRGGHGVFGAELPTSGPSRWSAADRSVGYETRARSGIMHSSASPHGVTRALIMCWPFRAVSASDPGP